MCLDSCLGSYLCLKANGNIVRRPNRMICLQTWADGDFLRFLVVFKTFCTKNHSESSKNEILWTWWLTLESTKKFSVGYQHLLCVFGWLIRIISISQSKREHRTTSQSHYMLANVSWWRFFTFFSSFQEILHKKAFKIIEKWDFVNMMADFGSTKKFSVGNQHPLCVFG